MFTLRNHIKPDALAATGGICARGAMVRLHEERQPGNKWYQFNNDTIPGPTPLSEGARD